MSWLKVKKTKRGYQIKNNNTKVLYPTVFKKKNNAEAKIRVMKEWMKRRSSLL